MCEAERLRCDREIAAIRERTRPDLTPSQEYQNRVQQEALDRDGPFDGGCQTTEKPSWFEERAAQIAEESKAWPKWLRDAKVRPDFPRPMGVVNEWHEDNFAVADEEPYPVKQMSMERLQDETGMVLPREEFERFRQIVEYDSEPSAALRRAASEYRDDVVAGRLISQGDCPVKQMDTRDHFDDSTWSEAATPEEMFEQIERDEAFENPPVNSPGYVPGPGDGGLAALHSLQQEDMVNSPSHYTQGASEIIDQIRQSLGADGFTAFCIGNVIKYANRARFKGNLVQDMAKAAWYARMAAGDDPRLDV